MKTKVIGLTGGIGSGKSTVARMFEQEGIPVYYADDEAKNILNSAGVAPKLKAIFGEEVIKNGTADRKLISAVVFNDKEKLSALNSIIHPEVAKHFSAWVENNSDKKFVIKEAAILFESGSYKQCDVVITVTAPLEERIKRVMLRDGVSREDVLKRMQNQWSQEEKIALSDYVIINLSVEQAQLEVARILNFLNFPEN